MDKDNLIIRKKDNTKRICYRIGLLEYLKLESFSLLLFKNQAI